jgi:hypothetical protein
MATLPTFTPTRFANHRQPLRLGVVAAALTTATALGFAASAHGEGAVTVQFVEPQKFADAGPTPWDRERHLASLRAHMAGWQARLPDGQTLDVEVLDLDLAGWTWPQAGRDLRIVTGRADAPSAQLRWSLKAADGRVLQSGSERIIDLGYFDSAAWLNRYDSVLPYEKRLLDRWFGTTFPSTAPPR